MQKKRTRRLACLVLAVLLPVPSIGVWIGLWMLPDSMVGRAVFLLSKVWLFSMPVGWRLIVERGGLSLSPPRRGGLGVGIVLGMAMSLVILVAYALLGPHLLDRASFAAMGERVGLSDWRLYVSGAVYWIAINSLLEEMVWRWFVVERLEDLGLGPWSVWASALAFTLHHALALLLYCSWSATLLCCIGIFLGGAIWSALYRRYRSIWPGYLSHAIVDLAVFSLGWVLIGVG